MKILCRMLQWWIRIFIYLSKPIVCTTPRVKPNVNYGLWVMMIYLSAEVH